MITTKEEAVFKGESQSSEKERKVSSLTCWVDELGFFSLIRLFLIHQKQKVEIVNYLRMNRVGKLCMLFPVVRQYFQFHKVQCNMAEMKSEKGVSIFWDILRDPSNLVDKIARKSFFEKSLVSCLRGKYSKEKDVIELFLKQQMVLAIRPYIKLLTIVSWFCEQQKNGTDSKNLVIVKFNCWVSLLSDCNVAYSKSVCTYFNSKNIFSLIFYAVRLVVGIVVNGIWAAVTFNKIHTNKSDDGKIAVLHVQGSDLTKKSDFFWYPDSGMNPDDLIVYFRVPYRSLSAHTKQLLNEYKIKWVDLTPKRTYRKWLGLGVPEIYVYPSFSYVKNLIKALLSLVRLLTAIPFSGNKNRVDLWEYNCISNLLYHECLYESFFEDYKVKIHYSLLDGGQLLASNMAARLLGLVGVSNHWSNYYEVWIDHGKAHDVYFSWGPHYKRFLDNNFYLNKYLIYFGYPHDRNFAINKINSLKIRRKLEENGAKFVICFLDEAFAREDCLSRKDFEEIYAFLLNKVYEDEGLALVIKPKRIEYYEREMPEILRRIREAEETGRCILLGESEMPNMAAQSADLTIGLEATNTAALEAALSGVPTVTIDRGDLIFPVFHKQGLGLIIFDDLELLWEKITLFRSSPDSVPGFADFSPFLDQIDPFRDGKSAERMGTYIKCLFDQMCRDVKKDQAINYANKMYQEQYGLNMVVSRNQNNRKSSTI